MDRAFWWPYGCAKGTHESRLATYGAAAGTLRHSIMTGTRTGVTATCAPLGPMGLGSASTLAAKLSTWHAGSPGAHNIAAMTPAESVDGGVVQCSRVRASRSERRPVS